MLAAFCKLFTCQFSFFELYGTLLTSALYILTGRDLIGASSVSGGVIPCVGVHQDSVTEFRHTTVAL